MSERWSLSEQCSLEWAWPSSLFSPISTIDCGCKPQNIMKVTSKQLMDNLYLTTTASNQRIQNLSILTGLVCTRWMQSCSWFAPAWFSAVAQGFSIPKSSMSRFPFYRSVDYSIWPALSSQVSVVWMKLEEIVPLTQLCMTPKVITGP